MSYLKSESGFTLLEIILGTAVLGILAVSVMGYWHTSTGALENMHARHVATELAKNSIDELEYEIDHLSSGDDFETVLSNLLNQESGIINNSGLDFDRQVVIPDDAPADIPNYNSSSKWRPIKVTVTWYDKEVVLYTIVADKRN